LIAELGGRPVAAMSLRDRAVMADPSERTGEIVELMHVRATQLHGEARLGNTFHRFVARAVRSASPRRARNPGPA
jgi:hypothetical protein